MPLMWVHAEYIKLLRSISDGKVSDLTVEAGKRYFRARADRLLGSAADNACAACATWLAAIVLIPILASLVWKTREAA